MLGAKKITRVFIVSGKEIADPNSNMPLNEIQKFLGSKYPAITNSNISGPEFKDGKQIYTFGSTPGTKG